MHYDFTTKRLTVKEWHAFEPQEVDPPDLVEVVEKILVPEVTNTFPPMWKGKYDRKRAKAWITERKAESKILLAVEKDSSKPVGFINFFREGDRSQGINFRLGYFMSKVMWGKGYATEFVHGFMQWCKENNVSTVVAGVDPENKASMRVLEKNNFITKTTDTNGIFLLFTYDFAQQRAVT